MSPGNQFTGLACVLWLCACDGGSPAPAEPVERSWAPLEAELPGGLLLSVWGASPEDVWIVGGRPGETVVLRGDRDELVPVQNPGEATAWWVCGLGGRIAIVGEEGLVLIETDSGDLELLDVGIESTLYGCWGTSPDDFWVVGGDPLLGPAELAHVQSGVAVAPDLSSLLSQLPRVLFKIIGVEDELLVVGDDGTVLRRSNDEIWSIEHIADEVPLFTVSATAASDVWVVGGTASAVTKHFDGRMWRDQSPALLPNLFGVSAIREETIVAGGSGALAEWRNGAWQVIETFVEESFHSVWLDGAGGAWAVGGNVLEPDPMLRRGVIWTR